MHMFYTYGKNIYSVLFMTYDQFRIPCLADIFLFPDLLPITFKIVHTCVSIQKKTNAHGSVK